MTNDLLLSAGQGPKECALALSHLVKAMEAEAQDAGVRPFFEALDEADLPRSFVVELEGENAERFARTWVGTIKWVCKSPYRPQHKRQNWFVGVYPLARPKAGPTFAESDLRFESFRAGGPGGQHQNTTNSAVRVTHVPSGLSTVSRGERSQHRNKAQALRQLEALFLGQNLQAQLQAQTAQHDLHQSLERGNPVRVFSGPKFREVR